MTDNIEELEIDFDQLESQHSRLLEQVKLDKALDVQHDDSEEDPSTKIEEPKIVEEDIIKLNTASHTTSHTRSGHTYGYGTWNPHDTSTWKNSSKKADNELMSFDDFDSIAYDPYDIGSGNSRFKLANANDDDNVWEAHAWPEDYSSEEPQEDIDAFFNGDGSKHWDTASRQWRPHSQLLDGVKEVRPFSKYREEQEQEDMMNVVYQTAEEIKYSVENVSNNVDTLENDIQEITTTTTFMANTVSGIENRMKKLETELKYTRQELKGVRGLLEIIVQYYTDDSDEEKSSSKDEQKN
jgi:hypothetical protein